MTSTYHQKWGQALYNAMAALYEKRYDFKTRIVGNYCFDIEPETENLRKGYRIAISQLTDMLKLKKVKSLVWICLIRSKSSFELRPSEI